MVESTIPDPVWIARGKVVVDPGWTRLLLCPVVKQLVARNVLPEQVARARIRELLGR
jgi:hypothetical protein